MFCVTPKGKNEFFITCSDKDMEKLKVLGKIKTEVGNKLFMAYACDVLEDMLESIVKS